MSWSIELVGSPDFVEHWTNRWADLLQVNRKFLGAEGVKAFRGWIKEAIKSNMPYDQFCYKLLTGTGSNVDNPPASYVKIFAIRRRRWRTPRTCSWRPLQLQ